MSFFDMFRSKLDSGSFDDRLKAIESLTDQNKLCEIVTRSHEDLQLRFVALKNISDEKILLKIIKHAEVNYKSNPSVYRSVIDNSVEKLTDQVILTDLARNSKEEFVRGFSAKRLTDKKTIEDIVKNTNESEWIRLLLIKKIYDQNLLTRLAQKDKKPSIREAAVKRMKSRDVLLDIARNDSSYQTRQAAFKKLKEYDNQNALIDRAKNDKDIKVCIYALDKIKDQASFADIAKNAQKEAIRMRALEKLDPAKWHDLLIDISENDNDLDVRIVSITILGDKNVFFNFISDDSIKPYKKSELLAQFNISDRKFLLKIYNDFQDLRDTVINILIKNELEAYKQRDVKKGAVKESDLFNYKFLECVNNILRNKDFFKNTDLLVKKYFNSTDIKKISTANLELFAMLDDNYVYMEMGSSDKSWDLGTLYETDIDISYLKEYAIKELDRRNKT